MLQSPSFFGESHSPVVHELWVLVVVGALRPDKPGSVVVTGLRFAPSSSGQIPTLRPCLPVCYTDPRSFGESHSPVVHELWVLVVVGSNPISPTAFL